MCTLAVRTVDRAVLRLEAAGFLSVERSHGRKSNRYRARLPSAATEVLRSEWATANLAAPNSDSQSLNSDGESPEVDVRGPKGTTPSSHSGSVNWSPMRPEDRDHLDRFELTPDLRHDYAERARRLRDSLSQLDTETGQGEGPEDGAEA